MKSLLELAGQIAAKAHAGQTDKGGQPYINHPTAVAGMVSSETEKIVALLHDVVEDSTITLDDIRDAGFNMEVVTALDCLTKRTGEAYEEYLSRVAGNDIARAVKLADLTHNMDTSRLPDLSEQDLKRLKKYKYAVATLSKYEP